MNRKDFLDLFAYSDNCWRLMGVTLLDALPLWDVPFETTSRWCSIRLLLAHCVGAEERLVTKRLQNLPLLRDYEDVAGSDWKHFSIDQQEIRLATYAYLASLSEAEIVDEEPVLPANDQRGALTRSDLLYQILNHENYHRGQAISALQRLGFDPPNFDYLLLKLRP